MKIIAGGLLALIACSASTLHSRLPNPARALSQHIRAHNGHISRESQRIIDALTKTHKQFTKAITAEKYHKAQAKHTKFKNYLAVLETQANTASYLPKYQHMAQSMALKLKSLATKILEEAKPSKNGPWRSY